MPKYPKRLIEVDLPIRRISEHARREKEMRRGHIPMLHIWWACRPPAACRAVICASLWPDPGDDLCPPRFLSAAKRLMMFWAKEGIAYSSSDSFPRLNRINGNPACMDDPSEIRKALLDFIADFANWDNSTNDCCVAVARALTVVAHDALEELNTFELPETFSVAALNNVIKGALRPLLVDPFAGGGAIPLEALRCGADAFASDLNPVAVLLNRVVLDYIPKYGERLGEEVARWGRWIKTQAEKELSRFYPKDPDGGTPIAYIWARTIHCEGPHCGVRIPLLRSTKLVRKAGRNVHLRLSGKGIGEPLDIAVVTGGSDVSQEGTIRNGSATCPLCGYTTPNASVRAQLAEVRGGSDAARMVAVVTVREEVRGRSYRAPTVADLASVESAVNELQNRTREPGLPFSLVPDEPIPPERPSPNARGLSAVTRAGVETFGDLFTSRQKLSLSVYSRLIRELHDICTRELDTGLARAVVAVLALAFDKMVDMNSSFCVWQQHAEIPAHLFARQAVAIVWDFAEANPLAGSSGSIDSALTRTLAALPALSSLAPSDVSVSIQNACEHPLPDDSVQAFVTDPPYYDAIPYADLSDFFYVWLRRSLWGTEDGLFSGTLTPKDEEAIWNPGRRYGPTGQPKDQAFYTDQMMRAFREGRRLTVPSGVGAVVFAHKSTAGWEAVLGALLGAGWVVTASWPIDTEMASRTNAKGTASLASSVHLVCRPREAEDGSLLERVGDWRNVLAELPGRITEWLPRLASEGVVGADAIFACLGPALEIFSRYSSVEKASGEKVELREYLEHVWAEVARQALNMIFEGADASGFEEDARLTAMWLWTLRTGPVDGDDSASSNDGDGDEDEEDEESTGTRPSKTQRVSGYMLEYDAARKIAQGLGCHLETLGHLAEVKGSNATLLSANSRAPYLFGRDDAGTASPSRKRKKGGQQLDLFRQLGLDSDDEVEQQQADLERPPAGKTVLDQLHQSMLLFNSGRGNALARFLVEDGVGANAQFWVLAQAFSALYPGSTEEKRWVDGVLARKKGLGF